MLVRGVRRRDLSLSTHALYDHDLHTAWSPNERSIRSLDAWNHGGSTEGV
jgi:hypothetical protein